jgi:hypothetical protein
LEWWFVFASSEVSSWQALKTNRSLDNGACRCWFTLPTTHLLEWKFIWRLLVKLLHLGESINQPHHMMTLPFYCKSQQKVQAHFWVYARISAQYVARHIPIRSTKVKKCRFSSGNWFCSCVRALLAEAVKKAQQMSTPATESVINMI